MPNSKTIPNQPELAPENVQVKFQNGNAAFALLFSRWMDTNGWSHPVMTNLVKLCLNGASWLHSSQISGFRHGRLRSPGPRAFIGMERLNFYLHRYKTQKLLLPGTASSNFYSDPYVITENGQPPDLGWWVEVFCGTRLPSDVDLKHKLFSASQAEAISRSFGRLIRRLLAQEGYDLFEDLEKAVRTTYPARDDDRVAKLLCIIRINGSWDPEELANELPALTAMTSSLGGPEDEDQLLQQLTKTST